MAGDTIFGDAGQDVILGDHGILKYADDLPIDLTTLDQATTTDFGDGGADEIFGGEDNDLIFGGTDGDRISGGSEDDVVLGDYADVTLLNNQIDFVQTIERTSGDADIIFGDTGDDLLVGGVAGDFIDGNQGSDLIFGDNLRIMRRDGVITNRRFQTLLGQVIYSRNDIPASLQGLASLPTSGNGVGEVLVKGEPLDYRDPDGTSPAWAEYLIVDLFHSFDIEEGASSDPDGFGDDYIAGGQGNDQIFGQLGNDTIQGDGGIESAIVAIAPDPVGAQRVSAGIDLVLTPTLPAQDRKILQITPSFEDDWRRRTTTLRGMAATT